MPGKQRPYRSIGDAATAMDGDIPGSGDGPERRGQTLLEYAEKWKASEDSLPLLEVYTVAIQSYSNARPYLTSQCENVSLVLERLALSCIELLLCLPQELPSDHWERFQGTIKAAHTRLTENGSHELMVLYNMSQEDGVWRDPVLDKILSDQIQDPYHAEEFLHSEGPLLLEMRIKRLLKLGSVAAATGLAKICSDHQEMSKKGHFKQLYLKCLCAASPNIKLIEEIAKVDCKDALEMICNLESEGDEKTSLILCAAFLSRQLQFGEMYCAWELTLFWSKLQRRVEPSIQVYLEICRQLSQLTKTVYHIFFLIKVIQSETEAAGLPTCIELCVRALRLESSDNAKVKISICKTISCLLPDDLEVKRACQLTEFLLEPTVDAYYAVEMLYNQPDQKYDEESLPVPNSLRCELLLVLKTRWPFDPEFWDWKTLKRQCLALMGEEASIVSSIDELNDNEAYDQVDDFQELTKDTTENGLDCFTDPTPAPKVSEEKKKKKRIKKIHEQGYISARFRNWQAYMQYCVLCDKEFLGHRIIRHAQKHCIDGIYSCPICAKQYTTKETFIPHVTLHVKQSCKERLETMQPHKKLVKLPKKPQTCKNKKTVTNTKQERQVKKNTLYSDDFIVFNDNDNSDENDEKDNQSENLQTDKTALVNEFPCPVQFCNKGFKYFKNLIAHVKGHKDSEEAARFLEIQSKKVVCQYCRRQFVSLTHINDHLQMHCGSQPYICIQMKCKASFDTYADLLTHRKAHQDFKARCMFPKCGRIFSAAYMLFDHEAQHYNTFTCKIPGCGKVYHSELQLQQHLFEHSSESPLPESNKSGDLPKMTVVGSKCVSVKGKSLQKSNGNKSFNALPSQSSDVPSSTMVKDPSMPGASLQDQKSEPVSSSGLEKSMHMLSQLLPSSSDAISNPDLLNQVLPTASVAQNILPKAEMLAHPTYPADSRNIKLPSLVEGFPNILSENKMLTSADHADEAHIIANSGMEEQCLSLFQEAKNSTQVQPRKALSNAVISTEIKIEADKHMSDIIPFNDANQTAQLSENNLMSGYEDGAKTENLLPLSLETSNALSNVLPPVTDATVTPVLPAPTERFKCNVEGCTRIYNSVQSIGKHMKSTHPEHYNSFKTERKNRKRRKAPITDETPTYCILAGPGGQNNSSFQSPLQNAVNPSFCNQLQHLPNPVFPTHLGNLVNPLLSSVETVMSQGMPKNVAETLLGPEVGNLNNATLTSQIDDLAKVLPMKFENGSDPFLPIPTENDPLPVMSSLSGSTMFSQLGSNSDHVLAGNEANNFLKEDADSETSFSKQVDGTEIDANFNLDKSSAMLSNSADKTNSAIKNKERKSKHSPRAKCPAIVRDGKFICSRCFRVFTNPRSLGGHLSKRAVCKPHNDYDLSQVVSQKDGQPSVLASMILSSSPKQTAQPPAQTFSPEITVKDEPFLTPVHSDNDSTQYLHSGFIHPSISSYSPSGNKMESPIKQNFETSENISCKALPHKTSSDNCINTIHEINTAEAATAIPTHVLQNSYSIENEHSLENINISNCPNRSEHPELEQVKTSNVICPVLPASSVEENHCIPKPVSSTRVSVISGPQSSLTTTKKRSNSSKRKKKIDAPVAVEASHELAKNILAAVGGNLQMATEMQPNFMAYGSDLLENLAKHLSSADKELFMSCINESLKASSETHTISQLSAKQEKSDSLQFPAFTSDPKGTEKLNVNTDFKEKTFETMPSDPTDIYSKGNIQNICSTLPQSQSSVSSSMDDEITGVMHNVMTTNSASSPSNKMNIPICSVSPTQETNVKYDEQVLEIMDLVQKLQLVDNVMCEGLGTEEKCPPFEKLPIMSSVIVPNPSISLLSEQTPDAASQLGDKCNEKPFICQEEGCNYCAMTKDALFKHYTKVHYYTEEKLGEIKKHQLKFAPFRCVVPSCTKTFTRNSNLRAHCQSMHRFTSEQMIQLKIKRPYARKSVSEGVDLSPEMPSGSPEVKKCVESYEIPLVIPKSEPINQNSEMYQEWSAVKVEATKVEDIREPLDLPSGESHSVAVDQQSKKRPKIRRKPKEKEHKIKKAMEKDGKPTQGSSTYKPYQCVHEGCTAAFTIQQNLILHYQIFHKSDASKFSLEEDIKEDSNGPIITEFRCTETDCSRIFSSFASLIQHYVKLHEMIAEEIENVLSSGNIGQFNCDQNQCAVTFTTCSKYIEHIEEVHGIKMKPFKMEGEEMYKCDCEGCDRMYATRSNLLRHIYIKHKDKHKEHLIRPRKMSVNDQDNVEEKTSKEKHKVPRQKCENDVDVPKPKKSKVSNGEKGLKSRIGQNDTGPSTLKYGRHTYSLKDKEVALAECTDDHTKQYPCMVRGCTSIVGSEHNMIRHYKSHKLSRPFIVKHKKALIVCKRSGRAKTKEVSPKSPKLDITKDIENPEVIEGTNDATLSQEKQATSTLLESSDESTISASQQSETEKDEMDELTELFISKLSNEESTSSESQARTSSTVGSDFQESNSCQSDPQRPVNVVKRTNKQKHGTPNRKRKNDTHDEILSSETSCEDTLVPDTCEEPPAFDLGSFKPMGFEVSFLKFLEETVVKEKKTVDKVSCKTETEPAPQPSEKRPRLSVDEDFDTNIYLLFSNPSHLPNMDNVKIVLNEALSDYIELVLKQLNELKPVVVLKRHDIFCNELPNVAKEQNID
ncbi:zinc finger protein 292 isoform X2 [Hyla sarda]|uniref:zinc finger protein 292 isoform X2 n=1 Tax=Hyla sarda TaxID=327740 RepID=UPI0024C21B24|nr:zinc finger protein 292 isoform X2 [Hyla sarda]